MNVRGSRWLVLLLGLLAAAPALAADAPPGRPAWVWAALLFAFCLVLGLVTVLAGVGGGVLYVPLVDALFPFHLDFVRGAGLWIAVAGSLSSGPALLRRNLASLRLAVPCGLFASLGAILGARLGLAIPKEVVQLLLGLIVFVIALAMRRREQTTTATERAPDRWAELLGMRGSYFDRSSGEAVPWHATRVAAGLGLVFGIGVLGGMFGVGAGWATVPTLNLLMGVPLKVATASSVFLISLGSTSAAFVYFHQGSVLPVMVAPSVVGLLIGARIGARLLDYASPSTVRRVVVVVLFLAGLRSIAAGLAGL